MSTIDTQIEMLHLPAETPGEPATSEAEVVGAETLEVEPAVEPDFDWFADDSVVIREQLQTAVYRNRVNAVVIRQEGSGYEPEDQFVILRDAEAVRTLIAVLQRELRSGG
jgi:hypothetical protein